MKHYNSTKKPARTLNLAVQVLRVNGYSVNYNRVENTWMVNTEEVTNQKLVEHAMNITPTNGKEIRKKLVNCLDN